MNTIIIGSGAIASELTSYIDDQNKMLEVEKRLNIVGYLDEPEAIEKYWAKYKLKKPVLSDLFSYEVKEGDHFIIGLAKISFRKTVIEVLRQKGAKILSFIHHSCIVADTAQVGTGNIIYPHCIIGPNCILGDNNFITSYSFISHDCIVGNNNFFSTAGLGGEVSIGDNNFFGIRSTVIPKVNVGSDNIIQAGMTLHKDVTDNETVFYRFKEKISIIK